MRRRGAPPRRVPFSAAEGQQRFHRAVYVIVAALQHKARADRRARLRKRQPKPQLARCALRQLLADRIVIRTGKDERFAAGGRVFQQAQQQLDILSALHCAQPVQRKGIGLVQHLPARLQHQLARFHLQC